MDKFESQNNHLFAVYENTTGNMYFWLPGKFGLSFFYQYHPSSGWRRLSTLWLVLVKNMIVSEGKLYYTLYEQWDPTGHKSYLYSLDLKTCRTTALLQKDSLSDIYAAGNGKLLIHLLGYKGDQHKAGIYYYSVDNQQLSSVWWHDYAEVKYGEKGISLKKTVDDTWKYYDYNTETVFETGFSGQGCLSADIFSKTHWQTLRLNPYVYSIYLNGNIVQQIDGHHRITMNESYEIWYDKNEGKQTIHVMDVHSSENNPQLVEYEVSVYSNIFILSHFAVMMSDVKTATLTLIDLSTGEMEQISPRMNTAFSFSHNSEHFLSPLFNDQDIRRAEQVLNTGKNITAGRNIIHSFD